MKSKDTERAKALKEQLDKCLNYLNETNYYNGIKEPLNIYSIGNFINKELYWTYDYISNYEYLKNSELLSEKIKDLIIKHTQFLINNISDDLDPTNTIKSVINELTNNAYIDDIKTLKKEL